MIGTPQAADTETRQFYPRGYFEREYVEHKPCPKCGQHLSFEQQRTHSGRNVYWGYCPGCGYDTGEL